MKNAVSKIEFTQSELLSKLNAPSVTKIRPLRFQYSDSREKGVGGFAQVRFENGGRTLIAEASFWGKRSECAMEEGFKGTEMFELKARQNWMSGNLEIMSIMVDGESYDVNDKGLVELAFSIFHSRFYELELLTQEKIASYEYDKAQGDMFKDALNRAFGPEVPRKARVIRDNMPIVAFNNAVIEFDADFLEISAA